jgi:uncharacterized protein YggE
VRFSIAVALASVLVTGCASAQTQTPTRDITATIVAGGEGRREVAPDKATIILGVQTRSRTPSAAASANADRMTAIRAALTRMGIPERDISTARYSLHFEHGRTPADTQYVANNMVTVETRQLDQVGRIIDTGLGAGANNINSLQYDLNDRTSAQNGALADAVTNARLQAETMATAAGGRLGELIELTTQPGQVRPYAMDGAMYRMAEMSQSAPTPVSPGSVSIYSSVTGRWRFIPGR